MQGPGKISRLGEKVVPGAQLMLHLTPSLPDKWQNILLQPVIGNSPENKKRLRFPENKITNTFVAKFNTLFYKSYHHKCISAGDPIHS